MVHRLVLETFRGPCPEGMEGCHNDGNQLNNRLENLRWDTHLANVKDRAKHGRDRKGQDHPNAKLNDDDVRAIRWALTFGIKGSVLARSYRVTDTLISYIKLRRFWKHVV
jgi:hypothetical protein